MKNISVIVPVYNMEKYLEKCLNSLVTQTLNSISENVEIVIVNDGSTDCSEKIILDYQKKYPNMIVYIKQTNGGLSNARNTGLKISTGKYIFFLDSDDYLREDTLEKLWKVVEERKSDIVICDTLWVYENSKKTLLQLPYKEISNVPQRNYMISIPHACGKLINKSLLDKMNFRFKEGIFYEDLAIIPSLAILADDIYYVKEPLYFYLQRTGSIMHAEKYSEKFKDIYISLNCLEDIFKRFKVEEKYKDEIEYIYTEHLLRSASMRFLQYKESKSEVDKIIKIMHDRFPGYRKNPYFKSWTLKSKIICILLYNRFKLLAQIVSKLRR